MQIILAQKTQEKIKNYTALLLLSASFAASQDCLP